VRHRKRRPGAVVGTKGGEQIGLAGHFNSNVSAPRGQAVARVLCRVFPGESCLVCAIGYERFLDTLVTRRWSS
jgi:hypothetical protein